MTTPQRIEELREAASRSFYVGSGGSANISHSEEQTGDIWHWSQAMDSSTAYFQSRVPIVGSGSLSVGSGSLIESSNVVFCITTGGGQLKQNWVVGLPAISASAVVSAARMLNAIKARLDLNVTLLAQVCRVRRPTIYQWLSGAEPSAENLRRLEILYHLVNDIGVSFENLGPGRTIERAVLEGRSALSLLSEDILDTPRIQAALRALVEANQNFQKRTLAEDFERLGFSQLSEKEYQAAIRQASRHTTGPEDD